MPPTRWTSGLSSETAALVPQAAVAILSILSLLSLLMLLMLLVVVWLWWCQLLVVREMITRTW